ncbi:UNVERIFIED_CONTAM: hypothetical protein GTU68_061120 [Idotea baltica]|nr:hypothetical protein [Idotea baltica]
MDLRIKSFAAYQAAYQKSVDQPAAFWADIAQQYQWRKPWDEVLDWNFEEPKIEWFKGATLNITENCLDRHLETQGDTTALIWEPNDPKDATRSFTYRELHREVCRFANVLLANGAQKGDRICLYMPMIPELAFAVLACARIGAIHSVVFAGFSANALSDRINDATCNIVITADGIARGTKQVPAKTVVDEALKSCTTIDKVIVAQHLGWDLDMVEGRDVWLHDALKSVDDACEAAEMDAEDMLFILYTSGSTGKPKGVVHTCGGYMVYAGYSFQNVFQYEPGDVYWCTADIGWITGHSYIIYGPLLSGATTMMFEGVPTWPDAGRFWEVVDKHQVNQFYTAPTAIRALMAKSIDHVNRHDLSSLKVLGTVGEPINLEAWNWYHDHIGKGNSPVVDTWWQTETGGIMLSGLGAHHPMKPTYAGLPLPGIQPVLLDGDGNLITEADAEGYLCIKHPWPSILRTTYGDHERCRNTYFSAFKGYYFTGDGARRDSDGMIRVIGRVDDVINVSGHRLGTAEIENAINHNAKVVESAVVGYPHPIKGQSIYAYVILGASDGEPDDLRKEIVDTVVKEIGKIARPEKIQFVRGLPKTRSGKIMRRILRKIAEGTADNLGDTSTLLDPDIVEEIKNGALV